MTSKFQVKVTMMTDPNRIERRALVRAGLPNRIDIWPVEITCAIPSPAPYCTRR
jgi:hypothetical protein